jgi:hypothetical protein
MIKNIYIYWAQGFTNAPQIVQICLRSWKIMNPTWNVIELDDTNLVKYIDIKEHLPNLDNLNITFTSKSDVIRIALLHKLGGVWCDATTFCRVPLDKWLDKYGQNGFWAFSKPDPTRAVSSWFLYGTPTNYIITRWYKKTVNYWNKNTAMHKYFWFHGLFDEMYKNDMNIRNQWNNTQQISAQFPHLFQTNKASVPQSALSSFERGATPVYKLTYKVSPQLLESWCKYFANQCDVFSNRLCAPVQVLRFLHIPKNAGTSIEEAGMTIQQTWGKYDTRLKHLHSGSKWHIPQNIGPESFCVIRNPFDKLLSQFRHETISDLHYNKQSLNTWLESSIQNVIKNPSYMDSHYLPQFHYIKHCTHILRFEHLQEDFDRLLANYNLPQTQLPRLPGGKLQQIKRQDKIFTAILTIDDISNANAKKIRAIYAQDFVLWEKYNSTSQTEASQTEASQTEASQKLVRFAETELSEISA